ncbi:hypothetical protein C1X73_35995, partial [Pseudomonas sp. FW305-130]
MVKQTSAILRRTRDEPRRRRRRVGEGLRGTWQVRSFDPDRTDQRQRLGLLRQRGIIQPVIVEAGIMIEHFATDSVEHIQPPNRF